MELEREETLLAVEIFKSSAAFLLIVGTFEFWA
jgi:hypothetical protein